MQTSGNINPRKGRPDEVHNVNWITGKKGERYP
jgi:hypothetical protein